MRTKLLMPNRQPHKELQLVFKKHQNSSPEMRWPEIISIEGLAGALVAGRRPTAHVCPHGPSCVSPRACVYSVLFRIVTFYGETPMKEHFLHRGHAPLTLPEPFG